MLQHVGDEQRELFGRIIVEGFLIDDDLIGQNVPIPSPSLRQRNPRILAKDQLIVLIMDDLFRLNFDRDISKTRSSIGQIITLATTDDQVIRPESRLAAIGTWRPKI
jgi:hypothetical protein